MEPRPAADSHAVIARWMTPIDANSAGFVHGGTVMKLCDDAAGVAAIKHPRSRVVTAGMDPMTFLEPVEIGELLATGEDERRREREAQTRRRDRLGERAEIRGAREP
jgi:acyl-CoA hydrolase